MHLKVCCKVDNSKLTKPQLFMEPFKRNQTTQENLIFDKDVNHSKGKLEFLSLLLIKKKRKIGIP